MFYINKIFQFFFESYRNDPFTYVIILKNFGSASKADTLFFPFLSNFIKKNTHTHKHNNVIKPVKEDGRGTYLTYQKSILEK